MPTHVSFEYLSDKRANFIFAGLAIPDVSGINTGRVRYLPSCGKIVVLGLVSREFQRSEVSTRVRSSDVCQEFRHSSGVSTPHIVTVT